MGQSDNEDQVGPKLSGNVSHIGNKMKRVEVYRKYKKEKAQRKLKTRIQTAKEERGAEGAEKKKARLSTNKPRTIENSRVPNPTIINAPNTHEGPGPSTSRSIPAPTSDDDDDDDENDESKEVGGGKSKAVQEEEEEDEGDDDEDPHAPPALLITTSMPSNSTSPHLTSLNARSHPAERTRDFVDELLNVFPGAEYRPRAKAKGAGLGKICGWARKRRYDAVLVVGESKKEPFSLTVVQLPRGPTAFFRLTSISMGKEIYGHARPTPHTPELILNNFTTVLGHRVGGLLQSLFPKIPQLEGRQVVTAHNQRDFIFFRRHRYMFKSEDKTSLQEIGPRFTLKLVSLKDSLPKGAGVWDGKYDGEYAEIEPEEQLGGQGSLGEDGEAEGEGPAKSIGNSEVSQASELSPQESRIKQRKRGAEELETTEFQWKPKMSVSRRNFYL
ncbi:Brix-domain-containing protein [Violaceomyces palustris]|uniref:Brix-domain-containing protein n=1 Tax=Violaceomyces palustris TaxID=1673888 RepID=A0ACD0P4Y8_9BASI|nr:Brix-domain-containing protein [Violaceomyces palustris]